MRKWLWIGVGLVVLVGLAVWLDPTRVLWGALRGEMFYQGRPVSYWENYLLDTELNKRVNTDAELAAGGEAVVPLLLEILRRNRDGTDGRPAYLRGGVAMVFFVMGPPGRAAVPDLLKCTRDPIQSVRGAAALALGRIGDRPDEAVPELVRLLGDYPIRREVLLGISYFGPKAEAAVSAVAEILRTDEREELRREAAKVLAKMGAAARPAVPQFTEALKDQDAQVRSLSAEALRRIGDAASGTATKGEPTGSRGPR